MVFLLLGQAMAPPAYTDGVATARVGTRRYRVLGRLGLAW